MSNHAILLELDFVGDPNIYDEPLTVTTVVSEDWLEGAVTVIQDGVQLDREVTEQDGGVTLRYEVLPGWGTIALIHEPPEPLPGDLDGDGDVDMIDLSILNSHWLEQLE